MNKIISLDKLNINDKAKVINIDNKCNIVDFPTLGFPIKAIFLLIYFHHYIF